MDRAMNRARHRTVLTARRRIVLGSLLLAASLASSLPSGASEPDRTAPTTTHQLSSLDSAGPVTVVLRASDGPDGSGVQRTFYRVDGGPVTTYEGPEVPILDRSAASFARWRHVGPGSFTRLPDGSVQTSGGLGLLWYPERQYGDVAFMFQWRDAATTGVGSNGGAFIRFPDPEAATATGPQRAAPQPCQVGAFGALGLLLAEWAPVGCGQEIQINDGDADPQQTGSVYNFKSVAKPQSRPVPQGQWNDYEIRTVGRGDYTVTVLRNGEVINTYVNTPGQQAARPGDPSTDFRQFAQGYFGLQNHGASDLIEYRDVRVRDLTAEGGAFVIHAPGTHQLTFWSVDIAGNVEAARTVPVTVR